MIEKDKGLIENSILNLTEIEFSYNGNQVIVRPYLLGVSIMGDHFLYGEVQYKNDSYFYRFELSHISDVISSDRKFRKVTHYKIPDFTYEIQAAIN